MGDLSRNFSRQEFACKCECGFDTVDAELIDVLQKIRDHFERPIEITSGARCEAYNESIGGFPRSQHLLGRAADFVVSGIDASLVQELADQMDVAGMGYYDDFTHIDTRSSGHARW